MSVPPARRWNSGECAKFRLGEKRATNAEPFHFGFTNCGDPGGMPAGRDTFSKNKPASSRGGNVCRHHAGAVIAGLGRSANFSLSVPAIQPWLPECLEPGWGSDIHVSGGVGHQSQGTKGAR